MAELFLNFPPGLIMVLLAMPAALVPHHYRQIFILSVIALSAFFLTAGPGVHWETEISGFNLVLNRADHLTLPFAIVFHIAAALNAKPSKGKSLNSNLSSPLSMYFSCLLYTSDAADE